MAAHHHAPARPVSLWHNRDYLLLWAGQAVSNAGSQVSQLAFPLLVLALTRSPAQAGLLGGLRALPYLLLCLPAGALVDRWNRKRVMIVCDTGRGLVLASIPVAYALGHLTLAQLYVVALLEGTLYVFFNPAETAALVRVVAREQLSAATARNEATLNASFTVGPFLGGALFAVGRVVPFLVDALSYLVSVTSLFFIRSAFQADRVARRKRLWEEIREGLVWLWRHPLLRFLAVLVGGGWMVESGYVLVVIVLAQRMGASSVAIGLILGVGGVGGVLGTLLASPISRRFSFGQITLAVHWLWALLVPLYALAPNPLPLGVITAAAFGITPIFGVTQYSYRLALIPDELQGRVNSVFRLIVFAGQPIGLSLVGVLLQVFEPVPAVLVLSALLVVLALAATLNRHVRGAVALAETPAPVEVENEERPDVSFSA